MRTAPWLTLLLVAVVQVVPVALPRVPHVARAEDEDGHATDAEPAEEDEAPEAMVGERLFLEPRFAQFFHAHAAGDVNATLAEGDPALAVTARPGGDLPGAFAGQTRSPVPARAEDDETVTVRNAPTLVEAARRHGLLHFDGEFASAVDLATATLTGRNYGWLPAEHDTAVAHVAAVIRGDDGRGVLAREFGGPYARLLRGRSPAIPRALRLPRRFRLDVERATDAEVLRAVGRLIAAYVRSLSFAHDENGAHVGSPYDRFVARNGLPARPGHRSARAYTRGLRRRIDARSHVAFVSPRRLAFVSHDHPFAFGREELRGFRLFTDPDAGNCIACHPAPRFTDGGFHDTGVAQAGYDAVHGDGAFAALEIPALATRNADVEAYLPATPAHPDARSPFRAIPTASQPGRTDLGLWNLFLNPDFPDVRHQRRLARAVCRAMGRQACRDARDDPDRLLAAATALFKTPSLRDLGDSAPYFHDGSAGTLEDAVAFYARASALARAGRLRNAAPELLTIHLTDDDVAPLAAFLRALDEDYE
jgi:cytochrome c peroxidase